MLRVARERGAVDIRVVDLRDYTEGRHRVADDYPFGGGGGMVLKPEPLFAAVDALRGPESRVVLLCPQGPTFTQPAAERLAKETHLVLLCGHYEGVDERVRAQLVDEELSIGDYVLTGGELPALVVLDAVVRLLPGVLGDPDGATRESFAAGRLDYPQYTRPAEFRGLAGAGRPPVRGPRPHRPVAAPRGAPAYARAPAGSAGRRAADARGARVDGRDDAQRRADADG